MRVVITGQTARSVQHLRQQVHGLGFASEANDCVSFDNLRLRLTSEPPADLVIVKTDDDEMASLVAVQQATAARIPVVVVTPPSADLQTQLEKVGALAFLDEARFRDNLQAALEKLSVSGALRHRRGRILAVTAAHSGNGVTTTATALAFALGAAHRDQVLLTELACPVPELALSLDLDVKHGLAELCRNWERSDAHMIRQIAVTHPGGVHVLAHTAETLHVPPITAEIMRQVIILLREMHEYLVMDLDHSLSDATWEAMQQAESVVVVVRPEVPALRLTHAYLRQLRDRGLSLDRVRLVINRTGYRQQVKRAEVEQALSLPIAEWVPDDPATMIAALNLGQPLIQYHPRARMTRTFERLARMLDGVPR